nr:oxidoreductase [Streptomyces sp. S1D4-11]QIY93383.1 oxidoreductase [Streptomyces sp. S1D4-11]
MKTTSPQVALVTGASSGIGKAATLTLADAGFTVIGTSRDTSRVAPGNSVTFLDLDVTSDESVASVVEQVLKRFGRLDVLVNNAGIGANGAAEEFSVAQTQSLFDVNVFGLIRMTKAVLPHMRTRGNGRIINVSSVAGFVPNPFMANYVATKHAVEGYSESLDHEVREHGVRVLRVQPGPVNTPFDANQVQADTPLAVYARRRSVFEDVMRKTMRGGDDPAVVAKVIAAAATDPKPKLRYTAGSTAGRLSVLRRIVPARAFDKSVRKLNRMVG